MANAKTRLKRSKKIIIFISVAALIVVFLKFLNSHNPMGLAFMSSFNVKNDTGETIDIVPIGMKTGSGNYAPLPLFEKEGVAVTRVKNIEPIRIEPNIIAKLTYDSDDINFRHIIVRDMKGVFYILDTDKKGNKELAYAAQKELYQIPPLEKLSKAPSELVECFHGNSVYYSLAKEY